MLNDSFFSQSDKISPVFANLCTTGLNGDRARKRFRFPVAVAVGDASVSIRRR